MSTGSLTRHEYHVTVRNAAGSFDFQLFDHIQVCLHIVLALILCLLLVLYINLSSKVRISVNKSRAHAQSLKLELLSLEKRQSPPPSEMESQDDLPHKMKRSELVKVMFVVNMYSYLLRSTLS